LQTSNLRQFRSKNTMPLILFDIDGTLLHVGTSSQRAFRRAFEELFKSFPLDTNVKKSGRTDHAIAQDVARNTLGRDLAPLEMTRLHTRYTDFLEEELEYEHHHFKILPGVTELMEHLTARGDCLLGIQTGNIELAAKLKLRRARIERHFLLGGYASDSTVRSELVGHALRRAEVHTPGICARSTDVLIVGDTPLDIEAGKVHGLRTVGVATGAYTEEALKESGADHVLKDFSLLDLFLKLLP
jgi:phosphoglycolate phosphatase-like HAD superfamily hydrolase